MKNKFKFSTCVRKNQQYNLYSGWKTFLRSERVTPPLDFCMVCPCRKRPCYGGLWVVFA